MSEHNNSDKTIRCDSNWYSYFALYHGALRAEIIAHHQLATQMQIALIGAVATLITYGFSQSGKDEGLLVLLLVAPLITYVGSILWANQIKMLFKAASYIHELESQAATHDPANHPVAWEHYSRGIVVSNKNMRIRYIEFSIIAMFLPSLLGFLYAGIKSFWLMEALLILVPEIVVWGLVAWFAYRTPLSIWASSNS